MIAGVEWLGYRRVSRVGGREHLISPELQADRIHAHAGMRGLSVRMLPPEMDVSGGRRSRPILSLLGHWEAMGVEDRRHLLGSLLGVVWVWSRKRFRFVGRGFEPEGLSRPGRKGPPAVPIDDVDLPGEIRAGG